MEGVNGIVKTVKPVQRSFYFLFLWIGLVTLILAGISSFFVPLSYAVAGWLLLNVLAVVLRTVTYDKERYRFADDRIIRDSGTLLYDTSAELAIKKITRLEVKRPFFRNLLFNTGEIRIESAGAGTTEITLRDLPDPEKWYQYIQDAMRNNGYKLTCSEHHYSASPAFRGVLMDLGPLGLVFSFMFLVLLFIFAAYELPSYLPPLLLSTMFIPALVVLVCIYQERKRRRYDVYNDAIEYQAGWFNTYTTLLPAEKLSDTSVTQTPLDKAVEVYDVTVSTKGTGNDVHFHNIADGPAFENAIDSIVDQEDLETYEQTKEGVESEAESRIGEVDRESTRTFYPDRFRVSATWASLLFSVFLIYLFFDVPTTAGEVVFWLVIGLTLHFLEVGFFTTYEIKENSFSKRLDFLSTRHTEFSAEKVTGIVVSRTPLDHFFGTVNIKLWNIGSENSVKFNYVRPTSDLIDTVLAKKGLNFSGIYRSPAISYHPLTHILAALQGITILVAGLVIVGYFYTLPSVFIYLLSLSMLLYIVYCSVYYDMADMTIFEEGVHVSKGIFITCEYYATLEDITDVATTKYPFLSIGKIRLNMAGDTKKGLNALGLVSQEVSLGFVENVWDEHGTLDHILWNRPEPPQQLRREKNEFVLDGKPAIRNLSVFWGFLFPVAIVLLWFLPFRFWERAVKSYHLDDYRVVERKGIVYKSKATLRYSKIDHIDTSKTPINNICGNETVTVQTTGSSQPELILRDMDNADMFLSELKKYY